MDLSSMLPLLMMMNGKNKKGGMPDMASLLNVMGGGNKKGGTPDMATLMQMMSALQSSRAESKPKTTNTTSGKDSAPTHPDLKKLQGMLTPEMIEILRDLGRKG